MGCAWWCSTARAMTPSPAECVERTSFAGGGGFSFSGPADGEVFFFAGDSNLGSSDITMTTLGVGLELNFSGLGEGINLDLGAERRSDAQRPGQPEPLVERERLPGRGHAL